MASGVVQEPLPTIREPDSSESLDSQPRPSRSRRGSHLLDAGIKPPAVDKENAYSERICRTVTETKHRAIDEFE